MIDLHVHSTVSDGSDPPETVVDLAAAAGCTAIALTDHDRLDGVAPARARARAVGIDLVAGCELSCQVPGGLGSLASSSGTMHMLVYFVDDGDGPLSERLVHLQLVRDERNRVMCERLGLDYDDLQAEAGGRGAGRPHAAALLVRAGRAASIQDAFDRWLGKGKPGYVEKQRLAPAEAIALARASGGVAVLAHPLTLVATPAATAAVIAELAELGLGGVECLYGRYDVEERDGLAAVTRAHGLAVTGGSDYHGTYKPDLAVGRGRGDLAVPESLLADLAARRP